MQPRSAHARASADRDAVAAPDRRAAPGAAAGAAGAEQVPAAVVIVSDRSARGERADAVGPVLVEMLRTAGYAVGGARVVPDGAESVEAALGTEIAAGARLVLTSGGTGVGPRDRTPEGTRAVLALELPGIAEALRRDGAAHVPTAVLSRGLAGVAGQPGTGGALVVNLPGSPGGARDGAELVLGIAGHAIAQLDGGDHVPPGAEAPGHAHEPHHAHGSDHARRGHELDGSGAPR
jgi:molybdenum cofactor synthesis domain-containing protein